MKVHFDVGMYQVDTNQQEFFLFCKKDFKKKKYCAELPILQKLSIFGSKGITKWPLKKLTDK